MFNNKIIKRGDAALFDMPSLDCGGESIANAEEVEKRSYEEGFASGEKAGFSEGSQKAAVLSDRLELILRDLAAFRDSYVNDVETKVVDLAVAIARRIIIEEISMKPQIIVSMVKEALKRLERVGNIRIKVNPALYDMFMSKRPELIEIHDDITFDVDSSVPVTGPLVISAIEEAVTDVDSMLENILEELKTTESGQGQADCQCPEIDDQGKAEPKEY